MTPDEAKKMYLDMLGMYGEDITLRRVNVSPTPNTEITVRARVSGYQPNELVGGIQQGDRKLIILAEDVTLNPGLKAGDKALVRGRLLNIQSVDDSTRRIDGDLIAYEVTARG